MQRRALLAAGALVACAAAGFVFLAAGPKRVEPAREGSLARATGAQPDRPAAAAAAMALPPPPDSLAGTEPDGGLVRDTAGRFVPTRDALDLFDYFLSASGEEPDAAIRARIEAAVAARLDDPAPALALLERYLAYRAEARAEFEDENAAALPLERRFQRIRELRRAHFGAELSEQLFGAEEERWRVDVERLRVRQDPALGEDERASRLAALDAELPAAVRESRDAATAALVLRRDETRLRSEGASDTEIGALRESRFGPEAAERLAALDRARAAWRSRVDVYRAERERVAVRHQGDTESLAAALVELRAAHFKGAELQRVEALDRIETTGLRASPDPSPAAAR